LGGAGKPCRQATVLILGHRGASADAPENTLEAFEEALRQKADGVELDVMLCGSGEVVVCHDERLDRLAGLDWVVGQTAWWKLRTADVGSRLGHRAARIPKLEEVLALIPKDKLVNVEIKCETLDDGGLTEATLEVLRRADALERVVVSSFNALCLVRLARLAPEVRRGYLIDPDRRFWLHGGLLPPLVANHSVHPYFKDCTDSAAEWWRSFGLELAVWTVDDPKEARRLEALGTAYCITNRPGTLREGLQPALSSRGRS
jgi:glycerophosphoryl diester phosphodiesterase